MSEKILSIENLTVSFKDQNLLFNAVDHVSIDLFKGQSLGIVGESGSGKSLTALSVLNLLPPVAIVSSGQIVFNSSEFSNINLLEAGPKLLNKVRGNYISMIFQEPMTSLNPVYTCGNQVIENILQHKNITKAEAKEKVLELFADVKLPTPERIFQSYPHELSGGQRQRVMIAMALSCGPEILIADEPTTALDVTVQKSILELLNELKVKFNMSLIFISHDLGVVSEVADEIAVMHNGEIVEQNIKSEILENAKNSYTKGLIACRPSLYEKSTRLLTLKDFTENGQNKKKTFKATNAGAKEMMREKIFEISSLSKFYPVKRNFFGKVVQTNQALEDINLDVFKGETLGLVGESGSGKSTLGRVMLNLLDYEKGEVNYEQRDLKSLNKKELKSFRQKVQIIFQDPYSSLNPRISVGEMISEPLKYYKYIVDKKLRKRKVLEILNNVKLTEEFYYRYPHELSGGQRQRVAIARVLALNPEFIVCDEAVSALDVSVQAEILNLLQDLKEKYNLTYVFISHDFSVIRFMADRIAVMREGRIVELEYADDLLARPKNKYTKELLNSIPAKA